MTANPWIVIAAAIVGALGTGHLVLTWSGPKLRPRDPALQAAMERSSPGISSQFSMWQAWIGFNLSHSLGAMLFGLVYGYLALRQPAVLSGSVFLLGVGLLTLVAYVAMAWRYWFRNPLLGASVALGCYLIGMARFLAG